MFQSKPKHSLSRDFIPLQREVSDRSLFLMKMRKKSELPSKICLTCGLAFAWRKKWARDWDHVKYCSERCRRANPPTPQG